MSRNLLFYLSDLKAAGVLDAACDLQCTLENDMFSMIDSLGFRRRPIGNEKNEVITFIDSMSLLKPRPQPSNKSKQGMKNGIKAALYSILMSTVPPILQLPNERVVVALENRDLEDFRIEKDIHPVFALSKFERATELAEFPEGFMNQGFSFFKTTVHPLPPDAYKRLRPTLQLASRILVDRRYMRFWASIVRAKEMDVPRSKPFKITLVDEEALTADLVNKTHLAMLELARDLVAIVFCTYKNPYWKKMRALWIGTCAPASILNGCGASHIELNIDYLGPLLDAGAWNQLTPAIRTHIRFQLLDALLHEISHSFFHSHFAGLRDVGSPEPVIEADGVGLGDAEMGEAWTLFFVGGKIEPNRWIRKGEGRGINGVNYYSQGLCLMDVTSIPKSNPSTGGLEAGYSEWNQVALPTSWQELLFTEAWFQQPYPVWDLTTVPKSRIDIIYDEDEDPDTFISAFRPKVRHYECLKSEKLQAELFCQVRLRSSNNSTSPTAQSNGKEELINNGLMRKPKRRMRNLPKLW